MVVSKLSQISCYLSRNSVGRSVKCKIFVICVNSDDVRSGQKDMSPSPKSMDNREEFSVVNVVISLCLIEGVGYTSDGSESTSVVLL